MQEYDLNLLKRTDKDITKEHYIYRIGLLVDEGKLPHWKHISDLLNQELGIEEDDWLNESAFRKPYQYIKKYINAGVLNTIQDDELLKRLEIQTKKLDEKRYQLQAASREYSSYIRKDSRFKLFYESISKQINELAPPTFQKLYTTVNKKEYVLTIADIHAGAKFKTDTNSYSLEECEHRFEILLNRTIDFVKEKNLNKINIISLGDDIQGMIRLTDLKINETEVVKSVVFISKLIASFLNDLSEYCCIEYYFTPSSNHSQTRPLNTKASELATEDVEYIIANYIKDSLIHNERINVHMNFGKEYIEMPILGFNTVAMHGHQIKSIEDSLKDLSFHNKKFYSVVFLAHYHASKSITVGEMDDYDLEVVIAPSFVGTDPYADKLMKGAKPACCIYEFDEKYGLIGSYKVILKD